MKNVLITGGAGFIGANFIRHVLSSNEDVHIFNLDALTYAGDTERLSGLESSGRYTFIHGNVAERGDVERAFDHEIDTVIHFAAESHVDRSIENSAPFERTNVLGTLTMLDAALKFKPGRFIHISTDEVYGHLGETGEFLESTPLNPSSPYSASKASGDLFVRAYQHTHGLSATIVRPSNNYGPWQFPEKLIPVVIQKALDDQPIPVYAQGLNVREWLHVSDCCRGVLAVLKHGRAGEAYNLGSSMERRNIEVVRAILSILDKPESLITYVADRPGHDFRYSLNTEKLRSETGWTPDVTFEQGLEQTVRWYVDNQSWWRRFIS